MRRPTPGAVPWGLQKRTSSRAQKGGWPWARISGRRSRSVTGPGRRRPGPRRIEEDFPVTGEPPSHTPSPGDCAQSAAPQRGRALECSTRAGRTPACTRPDHEADHECEWKRSEMAGIPRTVISSDPTRGPRPHPSSRAEATSHAAGRAPPPPGGKRRGHHVGLDSLAFSWKRTARGEGDRAGAHGHRPATASTQTGRDRAVRRSGG